MKESCPTCRFYKKWTNINPSSPPSIGCCHRYPRITMTNNGSCHYVDVVKEDDWCGEWIQKEDLNEF
jgi:hypothetical protein